MRTGEPPARGGDVLAALATGLRGTGTPPRVRSRWTRRPPACSPAARRNGRASRRRRCGPSCTRWTGTRSPAWSSSPSSRAPSPRSGSGSWTSAAMSSGWYAAAPSPPRPERKAYELTGTLQEVAEPRPGTPAGFSAVTGEWRRSREAFLLDAGRALAEARSTEAGARAGGPGSMPGFPRRPAVFGVSATASPSSATTGSPRTRPTRSWTCPRTRPTRRRRWCAYRPRGLPLPPAAVPVPLPHDVVARRALRRCPGPVCR